MLHAFCSLQTTPLEEPLKEPQELAMEGNKRLSLRLKKVISVTRCSRQVAEVNCIGSMAV